MTVITDPEAINRMMTGGLPSEAVDEEQVIAVQDVPKDVMKDTIKAYKQQIRRLWYAIWASRIIKTLCIVAIITLAAIVIYLSWLVAAYCFATCGAGVVGTLVGGIAGAVTLVGLGTIAASLSTSWWATGKEQLESFEKENLQLLEEAKIELLKLDPSSQDSPVDKVKAWFEANKTNRFQPHPA